MWRRDPLHLADEAEEELLLFICGRTNSSCCSSPPETSVRGNNRRLQVGIIHTQSETFNTSSPLNLSWFHQICSFFMIKVS